MQFLKLPKYNRFKISLLKTLSFLVFMVFLQSVSAQKKYTIVLDAGHGGKDSGNIGMKGSGYKEKNIALKVALEVGKELEKSNDINVVYTRKKDVFVELHNRAKIANSKKADLFVSIHCDAFTKEEPHGASTFVLGLSGDKENFEIAKKENAAILYEKDYEKNYDYNPNSPESVIGLSVLQEENLDNSLGIAGLIQNNFVALKRNNRRVKQANFLVLRETVMPSVLVELGFLTNKKEGKFLNTKAGQIKMAKAIARAIKKYVERLKLNTIQNNTNIAVVSNKNATSTNSTKKEDVVEKSSDKKDPVKTTPIKNSPSQTVTTIPKTIEETKTVIFKVQIAASRKKLTSTNFNFKGLKDVTSMYFDNYYKYYYGNSFSFIEIKKILTEVKKVGYKDAWVVAFKDGKRISIKEALKNQ